MKIPYISKNRIDKYRCPHLYYLYYEKQVPEEKKDNLSFGSMVHAVLERFNQKFQEGTISTPEEMMGMYKEEWAKSGLSSTEQFEEGAEMISKFSPPPKSWKVLGIEEEVSTILPNGVPINGFIDVIYERDDGVIQIEDYKTSRFELPQEEVNEDEQLKIYEVYVQQEYPGKQVVSCLNNVRHYSQTFANRRPHSLEYFMDYLEVIYQIIQKDETHEARPEAGRCKWCSYNERCQAFKDVVSGKSLAKITDIVPDDLMKASMSYDDANGYIDVLKKYKSMAAAYMLDYMNHNKNSKSTFIENGEQISVVRIQPKNKSIPFKDAHDIVSEKHPNQVNYCFSVGLKKLEETLTKEELDEFNQSGCVQINPGKAYIRIFRKQIDEKKVEKIKPAKKKKLKEKK